MQIQPSPAALAAINRLQSRGYEAYAVGGCVRDSLLGKEPNDWDLTTNATPAQMLACFFDCRVIETGIQHGTLTVLWEGEPLEITTYRRDGEYADNRHPVSVSFSEKLSDDLSRRDFTVNAMAYCPGKPLIDLFNGQADLQKGLIRCVGDPATRFGEDGLRILRAIRFAAVLGFCLEEQTAAAVHSCRHLLDNIARERVREEFNKLLCGKNAVPILREYTDVILQILPELAPCVGFAQNSRYHCYDVWEHTLHALEKTDSDNLLVRLSVLLHDIGKPHTYTEDELGGHFRGHAEVGAELSDALLRRLRYDNATRESVGRLIRAHDTPLSAEEKRVKRMLAKYTEEEINALLELARCDRLAHTKEYSAPSPAIAEIPRVIERLHAENACLSLKTLAVNGKDLMAQGFAAGKELGELLQALLEKVLDGELPNDKEALLLYAQKNLKN